jgi:hypothetical protein
VSYAIRNDGLGWRAVDGPDDCTTEERWTDAQPELVTPAPVVPQVVTRFQARAALLRAGLLDTVNALLGAPGADPFMKLAWEDAQEFKRESPTVLALASALGLTSAALDDLFRTAATIEA